ncbi:mitochondrial ribosomal subunit protein-domain-containing protein [Xylaria sp. CBS 124048]|nr:mitochondrial ribosomal subunit protein-domain-containing protein [Xylaria sp. CBS 124048]
MASTVQPMRLYLRVARRWAGPPSAPVAPRQYLTTTRTFSSTPLQRLAAAKKDEEGGKLEAHANDEDVFGEIDPVAFAHQLNELKRNSEFQQAKRMQERVLSNLGSIFTEALRHRRPREEDFWNGEEEDPDLIQDEGQTEKFEEDDIMAMGHGKFEEYREYREYARIAAWQMPLLSKLATPFEAPTPEQLLRFRFTSYMGELHPAEKKVVVEFCPEDMPLSDLEKQKLRKLLGSRLNPETDIAKMSCEQFEHPAQNKRYLGDLVNKLIATATDHTDMFEDVPLDTRHHTFKVKPMFPTEWRMTDERRKFLEETRQELLLLDQKKEKDGTLVDGLERITASIQPPEESVPVRADKYPELAALRVGRPLRSQPQQSQQSQQSAGQYRFNRIRTP